MAVDDYSRRYLYVATGDGVSKVGISSNVSARFPFIAWEYGMKRICSVWDFGLEARLTETMVRKIMANKMVDASQRECFRCSPKALCDAVAVARDRIEVNDLNDLVRNEVPAHFKERHVIMRVIALRENPRGGNLLWLPSGSYLQEWEHVVAYYRWIRNKGMTAAEIIETLREKHKVKLSPRSIYLRTKR